MAAVNPGASQNRVQVRLPEALMRQVVLRTGPEGHYADASDYIRDLIRRDLEAEQGDLQRVLLASLASPTQEMETDFFDDVRERLNQHRQSAQNK